MPHEHELKQNRLLAALQPDDLKNLKPHLDLVLLQAGEVLAGPDERSRYAYFPLDCVISLCYHLENGGKADITMIGNEGVFDIAQILGGKSTPYFAEVETTGHAFRMDLDALRKAFEHSRTLREVLPLYFQAMLTQTAQAVVCGRHHTLNQQLCQYLLLMHDKSLSDDFNLTHEAIAHMLGVRREGVTEAAGRLRDGGLIDYKHGHIRVIDRAGLEAQCCECYGVVKKEFERLLG